MKKCILTLMLVATAIISMSAADKITKKIATPEGQMLTVIEASTGIDVDYFESPEKSIVIIAPKEFVDFVNITIKNSTLKVDLKNVKNRNLIKKFFSANKAKVIVKWPGINIFHANSAGDIDIKTPITRSGEVTISTASSGDIEAKAITCQTLRVIANSAGDIDADGINVETVIAEANSAGDISLAGKCKSATLVANSTGDIDADNLYAESVYATSNSVGSIECRGKKVSKSTSSLGRVKVKK